MKRAAALFVGSLLAALLVQGPAGAQEGEKEAASYLDRMASSEDATYHSHQLVALIGDKQSVAMLDVRSSKGTTFVRAERGSEVTRLWRKPGRGIVDAPKEALEDTSPAAVPIETDKVLDKYEVTVGPQEKMLGVDVSPLTFTRRRDGATVERRWVDEGSGVVYRTELYDGRGKRLAVSAVLDMDWGKQAIVEPFDAQAQPPSMVTDVSARGAPRRLPFGYQLVSGAEIRVQHRKARHWVYSDGLHVLSVFRTPGGLRPPRGFDPVAVERERIWVGPGPGTWVWEGGGASWVMVAEEPALEPAIVTAAFPHGGPSVWARLGSVWAAGARTIGRMLP